MNQTSNFFFIDSIFDPPDGWLRASLPKYLEATLSISRLSQSLERFASFDEARDGYLREHWFEITGKKSSETHFSIIVPVHNEEYSLPSFLGALLSSEIPSDADVAVIFIINGSSDRSNKIIRDRLARFHNEIETTLQKSTQDLSQLPIAYQFGHIGLRFFVVETPVPGKANALNIGNEIANSFGHEIAMNIDANNWVEPDSIGLLYSFAHRLILNEPVSDTMIVNVHEHYAKYRSQPQVSAAAKVMKAEVTGWMFAWSTNWISRNSGFPRCAIEDYGIGLLALSQDYHIGESTANIWGYAASNFSDENTQKVRYMFGAMQLAQLYQDNPKAMKILKEDFICLRPLYQRLEYDVFQKNNSRTVLKLIKAVYYWIQREILILKARRKLADEPFSQTWEPISSTKGNYGKRK